MSYVNTAAGYAVQTTTERAPSQALMRLNALREEQNATHDAIARLEAALADVLLPELPAAAGGSPGKDQPVPTSSPHVEELDRRISVEQGASARILRLIDRLTA